MRRRGGSWARANVDAVRTEAGVGDQSNECRNGTAGCHGPDADVGELPCLQCLLGDDGGQQVATDGGARDVE